LSLATGASYGAFPGLEPAFIQGLTASGFLEGKNISIEWRWAEGQYNRLPSLASELVGHYVAVIVTWDARSSRSLSPRDMKLRLISSEADRRSRQAHDVVSI